eukprot:PhM_4_TR9535/c0_g1_i1/m.98463
MWYHLIFLLRFNHVGHANLGLTADAVLADGSVDDTNVATDVLLGKHVRHHLRSRRDQDELTGAGLDGAVPLDGGVALLAPEVLNERHDLLTDAGLLARQLEHDDLRGRGADRLLRRRVDLLTRDTVVAHGHEGNVDEAVDLLGGDGERRAVGLADLDDVAALAPVPLDLVGALVAAEVVEVEHQAVLLLTGADDDETLHNGVRGGDRHVHDEAVDLALHAVAAHRGVLHSQSLADVIQGRHVRSAGLPRNGVVLLALVVEPVPLDVAVALDAALVLVLDRESLVLHTGAEHLEVLAHRHTRRDHRRVADNGVAGNPVIAHGNVLHLEAVADVGEARRVAFVGVEDVQRNLISVVADAGPTDLRLALATTGVFNVELEGAALGRDALDVEAGARGVTGLDGRRDVEEHCAEVTINVDENFGAQTVADVLGGGGVGQAAFFGNEVKAVEAVVAEPADVQQREVLNVVLGHGLGDLVDVADALLELRGCLRRLRDLLDTVDNVAVLVLAGREVQRGLEVHTIFLFAALERNRVGPLVHGAHDEDLGGRAGHLEGNRAQDGVENVVLALLDGTHVLKANVQGDGHTLAHDAVGAVGAKENGLQLQLLVHAAATLTFEEERICLLLQVRFVFDNESLRDAVRNLAAIALHVLTLGVLDDTAVNLREEGGAHSDSHLAVALRVGDGVADKVEGEQRRKVREVLEARDAVVVKRQHAQAGEHLEALKRGDAVAGEAQCLQLLEVCEASELLDAVAREVQMSEVAHVLEETDRRNGIETEVEDLEVR